MRIVQEMQDRFQKRLDHRKKYHLQDIPSDTDIGDGSDSGSDSDSGSGSDTDSSEDESKGGGGVGAASDRMDD
jgi:hypothetical protein